MQFSFSDEQVQFRAILQRFLREKSPTIEVRQLMATTRGYDVEVWRQMAEQLGLPAIHTPEIHGGSGFGAVELCIVMEEFGRSLLCAPYFASSVLATTAIMNAATADEQAELLPPIASGGRIAALAFTEPNGRWDVTGIELTASQADADYQIGRASCRERV